MRICGCIAEYDPFHNGHAYHLRRTRELTACDAVVVCMNGSVSQRGGVMLLNKWDRAEMALRHGADIVVEMPALLSVRPADRFAAAGVGLIKAVGADVLSFGCETDDLDLLRNMAAAVDAVSRDELRRRLDAGESFARARGEALDQLTGMPPGFSNRPNFILALEYIRACEALGGGVSICPIRRVGDYHDPALGVMSSASAIRSAVARGDIESVRQAVPQDVFASLTAAWGKGRLAFDEKLDQLLIYKLRTSSADRLRMIVGADEGLEMLMKKHAEAAGSREALLKAAKCKRYTHARLNRYCANLLLDMTKGAAAAHPAPEYIRVLGFRRDAAHVLREIKNRASLPFVTDPVRLKASEMFSFDRTATDLRAISESAEGGRAAGLDLTHPIVVI